MKHALIPVVTALALSQSVSAAYLVSGTGEGSTYKTGYAPSVISAVSSITEEALFGKLEDRDGKGTVDNLKVCAAETETLCFGVGQGNVVATSEQVQNGDVCVVRSDLPAEFAFLFSNGQISDWGNVRKNWAVGRITLVTSAASSGSAATLEAIRQSAADLADAKIQELESWDAVIDAVKNNPRMIGFTHRYPDPSGFLDTLGDDHKLQVFGLAERGLRAVKHEDGGSVYTVDTVPFNISKRTLSVESTVSMGTPVVLFGNCPTKLSNQGDHQFAAEVHEKIRSNVDAADLAVDLGFVTNFVNKHIKRTAGEGGDGLWSHFDKAIEKAKELTN